MRTLGLEPVDPDVLAPFPDESVRGPGNALRSMLQAARLSHDDQPEPIGDLQPAEPKQGSQAQPGKEGQKGSKHSGASALPCGSCDGDECNSCTSPTTKCHKASTPGSSKWPPLPQEADMAVGMHPNAGDHWVMPDVATCVMLGLSGAVAVWLLASLFFLAFKMSRCRCCGQEPPPDRYPCPRAAKGQRQSKGTQSQRASSTPRKTEDGQSDDGGSGRGSPRHSDDSASEEDDHRRSYDSDYDRHQRPPPRAQAQTQTRSDFCSFLKNALSCCAPRQSSLHSGHSTCASPSSQGGRALSDDGCCRRAACSFATPKCTCEECCGECSTNRSLPPQKFPKDNRTSDRQRGSSRVRPQQVHQVHFFESQLYPLGSQMDLSPSPRNYAGGSSPALAVPSVIHETEDSEDAASTTQPHSVDLRLVTPSIMNCSVELQQPQISQ